MGKEHRIDAPTHRSLQPPPQLPRAHRSPQPPAQLLFGRAVSLSYLADFFKAPPRIQFFAPVAVACCQPDLGAWRRRGHACAMRLCGVQISAPPPPAPARQRRAFQTPRASNASSNSIYIYQLRMLLGCNKDVHSSATTANSGFRSSGSKDRTWSTWPIGRWFEAHKLHEVFCFCYKSLAYLYLLHHCELHNLHANATAAHQRAKLHLWAAGV
jgi:hypothetical protein